LYWGEEKCRQGVNEEARRKKQLRIPRSRWENNIKIDLTEMGFHKMLGNSQVS
jgi:hypothetical protein